MSLVTKDLSDLPTGSADDLSHFRRRDQQIFEPGPLDLLKPNANPDLTSHAATFAVPPPVAHMRRQRVPIGIQGFCQDHCAGARDAMEVVKQSLGLLAVAEQAEVVAEHHNVIER